MLKPKKTIVKKEIQQDPLLETIDKFQAKVEKNKQLYGKIVFGILALIIVTLFLVRNNRLGNIEADTALGMALISMDKGDLSTASFQFENIINDYESTSSADMASFYLGKINYKNNDLEMAQKHIELYLKSDSKNILHVAASKLLAEIYFRKNDLSNAINSIDLALKDCSGKFDCRSLEIKKAFYLIEKDELSTARELLIKIKGQNGLEPGHKKMVEELIGKVSS